VKYISTRGNSPALDFEQVLLTGLAEDGGLFVPESLPRFSAGDIEAMAGLSYPDLALRIIRSFVGESIPENDLAEILQDCYRDFRHGAVAPLVQLGPNEWVLELFHGPTLAFKDFALQLLGRMLDYVLERQHRKVVIMGATSGDTGSAAIEGCRRCKNIDTSRVREEYAWTSSLSSSSKPFSLSMMFGLLTATVPYVPPVGTSCFTSLAICLPKK